MSTGWALLEAVLSGLLISALLIGLSAGVAILRRRKRKVRRTGVSLGYSALWDEETREWPAQEGEGAHAAVLRKDS